MNSVRILEPDLEIHQVPLERIFLEKNRFAIEVDTYSGIRKRFKFVFLCALKIVVDDFVDLDQDPLFVDEQHVRSIVEVASSTWTTSLIEQAKENYHEMDFGRMRHFVVPVGDYQVEVVAHDYVVEDIGPNIGRDRTG